MAVKEAEASARAGTVIEKKRRPFLVDLLLRLVREKPLGTAGGVIVVLLFFTGVFAPWLAPYGYNEVDLAARLGAPSAAHLLGADNLGRDLLSRIIFGAQISMYVGLGASVISSLVSLLIGVTSGYAGGKIDTGVQRLVDAFMSFPPLFFYLTMMAVLGPGLIQVIVVLGVVHGIRHSRIPRSAVMGIKGNMYVEAARAIGCPPRRMLLRHILPNIMAPVITDFTVYMGSAILAEATLSFLGLGIPPPAPSWGGMLSGAGRQYMYTAPWLALWPGVALALVVFGINIFGDAMRDLLDPRLRGGIGRYSGMKRTAIAPASQDAKS